MISWLKRPRHDSGVAQLPTVTNASTVMLDAMVEVHARVVGATEGKENGRSQLAHAAPSRKK